MRSAMLRRVAIGVLLGAVGLTSLVDLRLFTGLIVVIAVGALLELRTIAERSGAALFFWPAFAATIAYLLLAMTGRLAQYESAIVAATVIASFASALFSGPSKFVRSAVTVLAALYIGKLLSYFIVVRSMPEIGAPFAVMMIFLIAFTDIFAMIIGKRFGRTKLTSISPAKTVEGALGGLCVATITGLVFAIAIPTLHLAAWQGAILGLCTSIAAQIGDLVESALKRDAEMKDAGSALLGHGGVLDRFDSYLFGGIAFYAISFVLGCFPLENLS